MANSHSVAASQSAAASIAWLGVLVVPFLASWDLSARMFSIWLKDGNLMDGPLMSAMAAVVMLHAIANTSPEPDQKPVLGYLALLATAIGSVYSRGIEFETGAYAMVPLQACALVWIAGGRSRARACTIAAGLLLLAMPIWDPLAVALQHLSVAVVSSLMSVVSIPVFVDGVVIHIPEGAFEVETGCSGVAFFIVAVGLALFMVGRESGRVIEAGKVAAVLGAVAIVTNWLRISLLILIGHVTDMQSSLMNDHYWFGWILFAAVLMPAIWLVAKRVSPPLAAARLLPLDWPLARGALLGSILLFLVSSAELISGAV